MLTRRSLLMLAALPALGFASNARAAATLVAAWDDAAARHWIGRVRVDSDPVAVLDAIEVPTRAHGVVCEADGSVLAVARRPGDWLLRWRPGSAKPAQRLWASDDHRFNGHVLSHHGALFTTETDLDNGEGLLVRRDARTLDVLDAWPTRGRDPHDIEALPDGSLLVANGGIDTRPETGRVKRELQRMDPSLVRLDARRGTLLGQWRLDDARLSIRHLALDARLMQVGIALQAEHDDPQARAIAPVLALFDVAAQTLSVPRIESATGPGHGYGGDVAACNGCWAVSRPRDGDVLLVPQADHDAATRRVALPEACALVPAARSDGAGWALGAARVASLAGDDSHAASTLRFDNHAAQWR